ncbi:CDP-diacylglycerol--serine O-phosphatidyltransferase [bacterium]|nr:CDP-diacylglycerol--serine O-phosphatidyltransferase [bacterium]
MNSKLRILPNTLTMLNMFFGFFAVVKAISGDLVSAGWCITIAAIFDAFDGKVARAVNRGSKFGMEFDSISDILSFGLAPAVLAYQAVFYKMNFAGIIICFVYLLCGGVRLARFNVITVSGGKKKYYLGLPIPIAAITLSSFIILDLSLSRGLVLEYFLTLLIALLCFLMVSVIPYDKMPQLTIKDGKGNNRKLIFLVLGLTAIAIWPNTMFFPLCMAFILQGIIRAFIRSVRKLSFEPQAEKQE